MQLKHRLLSGFLLGAFLAGVFLASLFFLSKSKDLSLNLAGKNNSTVLSKNRLDNNRYIVLNAEKIFGSNLTDTVSRMVARNLAIKYPEGLKQLAATQEVKANLSSQEIKAGVEEMLSQIGQETQYFYKDQELNLVPDTKENLRKYIENLKQATSKNLKNFSSKEDLLTLYNRMVEQNDSQARKKLVDYTDQSQKLLDELKEMPVPKSFAQLHLSYMNIIYETRYTALGLLLEQDDPIRTELVIKNYKGLTTRYLTFFAAFEKKVKEKRIQL